MIKKLQVFVSSTYLDLKDERQKAVEAILRSGHIPAGMELFTAGNRRQWDVIEDWIKESDVLMLILGGKYGSIEKTTGLSYTEKEYRFALENNIPVFAIVLDEQFLANKKSTNINVEVYEHETRQNEVDKYKAFKELVTSNLVRFISTIEEITSEVTFSLQEFIKNDSRLYHFRGWIRESTEIPVTPINERKKETMNTEHSLDKRTDAILQFQKDLEETRGFLTYFFSEPADFQRRQQFNAKYKNPQASPQVKEDILDEFTLLDMMNMLECALKQIIPIEEKMVHLNNSLNILAIYLDKPEEEVLTSIVKSIERLQYIIIGNLKRLIKNKNPNDTGIFMFLHIDEPFSHSMREINDTLEEVRIILKKYLYISEIPS